MFLLIMPKNLLEQPCHSLLICKMLSKKRKVVRHQVQAAVLVQALPLLRGNDLILICQLLMNQLLKRLPNLTVLSQQVLLIKLQLPQVLALKKFPRVVVPQVVQRGHKQLVVLVVVKEAWVVLRKKTSQSVGQMI